MEINYWAVLAGALFSMIFGSLWYGPLFGKKWIEINGLSAEDIAKREAMQKAAMPLYFVQFGLSLLQLYVLAHFVGGWKEASGVETSIWIWLGFVMPTVAGLSMWNMQPTKVRLVMFLLSSGYQLVCFVAFGLILGAWK